MARGAKLSTVTLPTSRVRPMRTDNCLNVAPRLEKSTAADSASSRLSQAGISADAFRSAAVP